MRVLARTSLFSRLNYQVPLICSSNYTVYVFESGLHTAGQELRTFPLSYSIRQLVGLTGGYFQLGKLIL